MITNKGNQIIAKYLLGQAPEYAGYLAVGVGAKPLLQSESDTSLPTKKSMDFEAFRVPIESKGIVNDTIINNITSISIGSGQVATATTQQRHGIPVGSTVDIICLDNASYNLSNVVVTETTSHTFKYAQTSVAVGQSYSGISASVSYIKDRLVFKAQLPPDQRYQMTEMAVFSTGNNQLAIGFDSKMLRSFSTTEGWVLFDNGNIAIDYTSSNIANSTGDIVATTVGSTAGVDSAKFIDTDNFLFTFANRKNKLEFPRLFSRCLIVPGNTTAFVNDLMDLPTGPKYIICQDVNFNFSKNSPNDVIKFALSIVSGLGSETVATTKKVRLRFELIDGNNNKATATKIISDTEIKLSSYQIISNQIKDFSVSDPTFNWGLITSIAIYVQTLNSTNSWDGAYVVFDGMRIDNENTENPLYGMIAYSPFKNNSEFGMPILKIENSQGYIEYRMGVSIY